MKIKKRFLFNTQFKWPNNPVDYSLALALKARGHEVLMLACGGLPRYCELETITQMRPACDKCTKCIADDIASFGLPHICVAEYIQLGDVQLADHLVESKDVQSLLDFEYEGVPVGELARLNLFQYFKGYPFEISGAMEEVFRRCFHSAVLVSSGLERIVDVYSPDYVVTVNGKFLQWAPAVYSAQKRNIPYVTWEDINIVDNGVIFAVNSIAHDQNIDVVWPAESKIKLPQHSVDQIQKHFTLWAKGQITPYKYYDETADRDLHSVAKITGIRLGAPVVCLFPNVSWDSTSVGFESAFESMYDWVFRVVEYAYKRPEIEFIIRAHPAEKKLPAEYVCSTPICDAVRKRYPGLPPNVKLIEPMSPVSSYALAELSSITMVYTSTLGIELALMGIRPWVAAKAYYAGKGFTIDIESHEHMLALIDTNSFDNNLSEKQIELAQRFAHIVRFRRIFAFPFLNSATGTFTPLSMDVFRNGGHPVIDNLCDFVLKGTPFLDIGWRDLCALPDLSNVLEQAQLTRYGFWRVLFANQIIYCHDLLSFYIAAKDIYLKGIYDFISNTPEPVIIDGGAHIGLFTLFIKRKYPQAKITAFEPDAETLKLLRYNLEANGMQDVTVVDAGLYSEESTTTFAAGKSDGSTMFSGETNAIIRTAKLSDYIGDNVDYLKLNIEGAELAVLEESLFILPKVNELVIEYHGFPEIGQNLHIILNILDQCGFRYLIHDFDSESNPATKPPFHIEATSRFFLLIYGRRLFPAMPGTDNQSSRLIPVSRVFGYDRGTPIDRYYIENFLEKYKESISGIVLEIGDNAYTRKFGTRVLKSEVLNAVPSDSATIVGDLSTGRNIPSVAFDAIILTQTLNVIYDIKTALKNAYGALKPGGSLLLTVPGISQISRYDMDRWGDFWRFTSRSLQMLLLELAPEANVQVSNYGNVAVAKAFIDGISLEELPPHVLDYQDDDYQVLLAACVIKPKYHVSDDLQKPVVLIYHRVSNLALDPQLLCVSPENFDAHLLELANNYRVVPLYQMLEECREGNVLPKTVSLTFDDGYQDNLINALPLLEKHGLHATIFVTSGMVGLDEEFWWDAVERIFLTNITLPQELSFAGRQWLLHSDEEKLATYDDICSILRDYPPEFLEQSLQFLFSWAGISPIGRMSHRVVGHQQLRQLAASPHIEIGAHAKHHVRLSRLSAHRQRIEIAISKQQLEVVVNKRVRLFSYPFGTTADFTADTVQAVIDAGFHAAIANIQGEVAFPLDSYAVPRRLVRNWNSAGFSEWMRSADKGTLETITIQSRKSAILSNLSSQHKTDAIARNNVHSKA